MTDEQINALVKEIVDGLFDDGAAYRRFSPSLVAQKEQKAREIDYILRLLSERYCIVEKSEIKEWVNTVAEVVPFPENVALKIGAERLFGKELLKEEEK